MSTNGFTSHDHAACISDGVAAAEALCSASGLNLTAQRKRVLEILLSEHRAMGAYDILEVLRADGQPAQPPVAYRALDFLVEHGFAHKVERLNAFVACAHPGEDHAPGFLICRMCKAVAEAPIAPMRRALDKSAAVSGFSVEKVAVEALGLCPNCTDRRTA